MLVIPPAIDQPQEESKKAPKVNASPLPAVSETPNSIVSGNENRPTIIGNTEQEKEMIIRNKKAYKRFIKLVKTGKFTTALLSSKLIGVSRNTIMSWLDTKAVQDCMNEEVNNYIAKIQGSKDWKAQAYLLDKTLDDNNKEKTVDIQNIILIKK